ncbi:MAG: STAS domain-containing protein [Nocardioidaceae bacterium]
MDFRIDVRRDNGYTVVAPFGEIDLATSQQLKEAIGDLLVDGDIHLVVDLTEVEFIDSTGLGALIGGRRKAHGFKGSFGLVCSEDQLLRIFVITGLDKVFSISATLEEALARPITAGSLEEQPA